MQKPWLLTNHCSDYGTARPRTGKSRQQQPDIVPEMDRPGGWRGDRSPFIARSKAMTKDDDQTKSKAPEFDLSAFPSNALFHERRYGHDRRTPPAGPGTTAGSPPNLERVRPERRARKERRKRIDPTTFDKQYTVDELEFMNAMQRFKEQTGKAFPTYGEVIRVAVSLGYRMPIAEKPSSSLDGSRTTAKSSSRSTEMNADQTADS